MSVIRVRFEPSGFQVDADVLVGQVEFVKQWVSHGFALSHVSLRHPASPCASSLPIF